MKKLTILKFPFYFLFLTVVFISCGKKPEVQHVYDLAQIKAKDTLVVGTMYGSSTYFIFKGEEMGFDYELCARFAQDNGLVMKLKVAKTVPELVTLLNTGRVDMVAYRLAISNELKRKFIFADNEYINNQVLIQRSNRKSISNVVGLIGKEVYVNKGTKYEERLNNLNAELGGGIKIVPVSDSLNVDNLIELVSSGKIDYTVSENDVALLNKTYFRNLDCKIPVSFSQRSAWAVRRSCPKLAAAINEWYANKVEKAHYKYLYNKYFVQAKFFGDRKIKIPKGAISPYDKLFKLYAKDIKWDWPLLAAICYEESRFDSSVVSWVGARGLMQLMPRTASMFNLDETQIAQPEKNIATAVKYIAFLNENLKMIEDKEERLKFVLAAYNAGLSHILDAMALAKKYGKDDMIWYGNVQVYLELKSHKEYYNDPIVKSGYFRGIQTTKYVEDVLDTYDRYKRRK